MREEHHKNQIVVGAGWLYLIEPEGGERYLGELPSCSVTVTSEYITVESSNGPVRRRLVHKPRSVTRRMDIELEDMSAKNLALFILGETGRDAQSAQVVEGELLSALREDVWYQLGVSRARPEGVSAIAATPAVTVKQGASGNTALDAAHYRIDHGRARILFTDLEPISGASKAVRVSYTPVAQTLARATSSEAQLREFGLRYIEDAVEGVGKRLFAPRCTVSPNGQMALKNPTQAQRIPLQVEILEPDAGAALVIYGPEG
ncbi:hypothetical protein [Ruegeria sp.]|uniref:phage tail tube protein n=1 Tax=Ruegeria sp. TaxID=1879320 RepID=UPI003B00C633